MDYSRRFLISGLFVCLVSESYAQSNSEHPLLTQNRKFWDRYKRSWTSNDLEEKYQALMSLAEYVATPKFLTSQKDRKDRILAEELFREAIDSQFARQNKKAKALAKLGLANFFLEEETWRITPRSSEIRQLIETAYIDLKGGFFPITLCVTAINYGLRFSDLNYASKWHDIGLDILKSKSRRSINFLPKGALYFEQFCLSSARLFALKGEPNTSIIWFETSLACSPSATMSLPQSVKLNIFSPKNTFRALEKLDAVIHLVMGPDGTSALISYKYNGKERTVIKEILGIDSKPFDQERQETTLWGRPYYRYGIDNAIGGWNGNYWTGGRDVTITGANASFQKGLNNMADFLDPYLGMGLWKELKSIGLNQGAKIGIIVPSFFNNVPFHLTKGPLPLACAHYFKLYHAPSSLMLSQHSKTSNDGSVSVLGFYNPTNDLDGAEAEREVIVSLFGDATKTLSKNTGANELLRQASDQPIACLYLASHGEFGLDRFNSQETDGLKVGRGEILTVDSILSTNRNLSTTVCVISGCEAARNPMMPAINQKPANIVSALLGKGVKGVIAAKWKVSDLSSSILMTRFMSILSAGGTTPAEALRGTSYWLSQATSEEIQTWMISFIDSNPNAELEYFENILASLFEYKPNHRPFSHPYHWASFTYFGSDV